MKQSRRQALIAQLENESRKRVLSNLLTVPTSEPHGMSPPQRAWFDDGSVNRLMLKANKIGGTFIIGAEIWLILTKKHPHINLPYGHKGLILTVDLDKAYKEDVCQVLRETQPPGILHEKCNYDERGYTVSGRKEILLKNGSAIMVRSSRQDPKALEGINPDWVVVNEPPEKHMWGAIMRCCTNTTGRPTPVSLIFTLVDDIRKQAADYSWLKDIILADDSDWVVHQIPLRPANTDLPLNHQVPHRSIESIQDQIKKCPTWEFDQRINAEWTAASFDRLFNHFDKDCVVDHNLIPKTGIHYELWCDHGERPGKEVIILGVWWQNGGSTFCYALDEYDSKGRTIIDQDAYAMVDLLDQYGLTLYHISAGIGDINTAGKRSTTTVNRELERSFAKILGTKVCPFRIRPAKKGRGSVLRGARILDTAFSTGTLGISPKCKKLINDLEHWKGTATGADADLKDTIDALRYGVAEKLDTSKPNAVTVRV